MVNMRMNVDGTNWWRSLGRLAIKTVSVLVLLFAFAQFYLPLKGYHLAAGPGDPGFLSLSQFLMEERRRFFGSHVNVEGTFTKGRLWENGMRASRDQWADHRPHRVLLVGDSWTFGVGVVDAQTFAWRLNQMFPDCAFDNAGFPGYGPYTAFLAIQEYLPKHRYDMVLYSGIKHHLFRDAYFLAGVISKPGDPRDVFLLRPSCRLQQPAKGEDKPRLVLEPGGSLVWPGDRYLCLINFLKIVSVETYMKLDMRREEIDGKDYTGKKWFQIARNEKYAAMRFRLLLDEMNRYARSNNCAFGFVDLQNVCGILDKYNLLDSPGPQTGNVDWHADFPILHAQYPVNIFKYRELHTPVTEFDNGDHPSPMVHAYYAQTIGDWLSRPDVAGKWIGGCTPVSDETGVRGGQCVVLPQLHPSDLFPHEALID